MSVEELRCSIVLADDDPATRDIIKANIIGPQEKKLHLPQPVYVIIAEQWNRVQQAIAEDAIGEGAIAAIIARSPLAGELLRPERIAQWKDMQRATNPDLTDPCYVAVNLPYDDEFDFRRRQYLNAGADGVISVRGKDVACPLNIPLKRVIASTLRLIRKRMNIAK